MRVRGRRARVVAAGLSSSRLVVVARPRHSGESGIHFDFRAHRQITVVPAFAGTTQPRSGNAIVSALIHS